MRLATTALLRYHPVWIQPHPVDYYSIEPFQILPSKPK